VATSYARNITDGKLIFRHALESLFQLSLQSGSATQVAGHIIANFYHHLCRRLKVEMRIIAGNGMDITQSQAPAICDPLQLLGGQILELPLNVFKFFKYAVCL